jgi:hypothetical protein
MGATGTTGTMADARMESAGVDNSTDKDLRPEKRARTETTHVRVAPKRDTSEPLRITKSLSSLSEFNVSRPATPMPDPNVPHDKNTPTEAEIEAMNAFLARLKTKAARAAGAAAVEQPPTAPANAMKYVPHPEGGFPVVHGRNPTHPFDNIDIKQLANWLNLPSPRVFAQPLWHGYYPSKIAQEIVNALIAAVEDVLDCKGTKVTAPIAAVLPLLPDHAPYTYLICGLSKENAAKLVQQKCWATQKIGFLVYTAEAVTQTYLGAIQGLNITDDDDDITAVRELVDKTFRCTTEIVAILSDISATNPNLAQLGDAERKAEHESTHG